MEEIKYIQEYEKEENLPSFDKDKFLTVLKKLVPWIILLFVIAGLTAYLVVRYTKPLYESKSVLKLDIKREASILGLNPIDEEQTYDNLLSEIELLESRLFYNKILDAVDLDISVYTIGDILIDERYKNAPFHVDYHLKNSKVYDVPFRVEIINSEEYYITYSLEGKEHNSKQEFGETIETADFTIKLTLGPEFDPSSKDREFFFTINSRQSQLNYIEENFNVQPLKLNTNTIEISFQDYNKQKARDMVNAIDTIYLNYTREQKTKANSQKIDFLNQQLNETEQRLSDFETYFEDFIITNKTTDLKNNLDQTIRSLSEIDSQRYILRVRLNRLQELKAGLDSGKQVHIGITDFPILPPTVREDIEELNQRLEESESILLSYNKNTQAYRKRINEIENIYQRVNHYITDYIDELEQQLNELRRRKARLERDFVELPSKNTDYSKSERYYSLYEEFYLTLMQKKAEFQLAMAGTVTDFKILAPATIPADPLKPKKELIYGIGLVAWVVITFFMIGIGYLSFNRITGLEEVERLTDIPVLGTIPFYSSGKMPVAKLVISKNTQSALGEAFRSLRTNMQFILPKTKGTLVSVSSTVSGEGKTFVGLNLAGIFAVSGKKALIVDVDLRKPKLNKVFGNTDPNKGLSTILIEKHELDECIIKTDIENLEVLTTGPIPPNPSELIMSREMDRLLKQIRKKYDIVFLDTPPVGIVTDGILVMKNTDLQMYILRNEYSRSQFVSYIEKTNSIHKFKHLYLIVNGLKKGQGVHYGYGYGSGYYREKKPGLISRIFNG